MNIKFEKYLHSKGFSPATIKNYKSDIFHFIAWLRDDLRKIGTVIESFDESLPFLSSDVAQNYKLSLHSSNVPVKTTNRRLSTLRQFAKFLQENAYFESDFMQGVSNISLVKKTRSPHLQVVSEFESHLASQKISASTIKNYLSDIKHFLNWLEKNQYAQSN